MVMTPIQKNIPEGATTRETSGNPDLDREAALARLLALLESEDDPGMIHVGSLRTDALSHIARLRNAHASYALATTGGMERESPGAWVRRDGHCARRIQ